MRLATVVLIGQNHITSKNHNAAGQDEQAQCMDIHIWQVQLEAFCQGSAHIDKPEDQEIVDAMASTIALPHSVRTAIPMTMRSFEHYNSRHDGVADGEDRRGLTD